MVQYPPHGATLNGMHNAQLWIITTHLHIHHIYLPYRYTEYIITDAIQLSFIYCIYFILHLYFKYRQDKIFISWGSWIRFNRAAVKIMSGWDTVEIRSVAHNKNYNKKFHSILPLFVVWVNVVIECCFVYQTYATSWLKKTDLSAVCNDMKSQLICPVCVKIKTKAWSVYPESWPDELYHCNKNKMCVR